MPLTNDQQRAKRTIILRRVRRGDNNPAVTDGQINDFLDEERNARIEAVPIGRNDQNEIRNAGKRKTIKTKSRKLRRRKTRKHN
jgi:hypothetical protein